MRLVRSSPRLFAYCLLVAGAGATLLGSVLPGLRLEHWREIFLFGIVTLLVELFPTTIPRENATVSPIFAIIYATILAHGPGIAAWVAALGTLRLKDLRGRVPWPFVLFNRGQLALSAAAAGEAYLALGGRPGVLRFPGDLAAMLVAGLVFFGLNCSAVVGASALLRGASFWRTWLANYRWAVPNFLGLVPLGAALAALYLQVGPLSLALAVLPLLIARQSFQRYLEVRQAYLQTIAALTSALDAKDAYTRGHCERVAALAVAIGKEMGLPEDQLELLEYVGRLHDVGKIGVRDAVLKKPGIFTPREYAEMQTHVVLGADIVERISLLGEGASWIRHHHERFDGRGFPDGLRGEQIPLGARIIAVADAYDALTSQRPYKGALEEEAALAEMEICAGTQFDPQVVKVLVRVVRGRARPRSGLDLAAAGRDEGGR